MYPLLIHVWQQDIWGPLILKVAPKFPYVPLTDPHINWAKDVQMGPLSPSTFGQGDLPGGSIMNFGGPNAIFFCLFV